ncbi:hypothetical protein GCM10007036_22870 [Alsobacter metallidurans]|uniref:Uncharacterized protein n=1 Tax=Alsobacter metallidurans TaxID=340221 RepID=A0A917MJT5_9HYPH|nr:hypothetical protein [Alsobacter metallidurans]GGH19746.1 hypothetical protein GCM10007036_22870 [Alsobacter metallidurans]
MTRIMPCGPERAAKEAIFYPADLLPKVQETLGRLADIELRYQQERARLARLDGPETTRGQMRRRLEEERKRERLAFERRLTHLHERMTDIVLADLCSMH